MRVRARRTAHVLVATIVAASVACAAPEPGAPTAPDVAASAPGTAAEPAGGGTLRVALAVDPVSIDPRTVVDDEGELVARALFEPLVDVAPDGSIVPAAASSWRIEDDGRTYVFTLRPATYHDGTPVTAEDHARAFARVADDTVEPRFRSDLVTGVTAVEVVDASTLVVRLDAPRPGLLSALTDLAFAPLPRAAEDDPAAFAEAPIGNGPFAMVEPRSRGAFLRLRAVEGHHRAPELDGILFVVYGDDADGSARWQDLVDGVLQVAPIPPGRRDQALAEFGPAAAEGTAPGLRATTSAAAYHVGFDVTQGPFDDVRLRRAVSAAIDRERIARTVLGDAYVAADRILPPSLAAGATDAEGTVLPGPDCAHCRRDVALARAELAAWRERVGSDTALVIDVRYPRSALHAAVAEAIARDLEAVLQAEVRLRGTDLATFVRSAEAGEAGLIRMGLTTSAVGPRAVAELLVPRFRPGTPEAWTRFDAPGLAGRLDALAADPAGALAEGLEVERDLLDAAAVVPLLWPRRDVVVAPGVEGLVMAPGGRWWLERVRLRVP